MLELYCWRVHGNGLFYFQEGLFDQDEAKFSKIVFEFSKKIVG